MDRTLVRTATGRRARVAALAFALALGGVLASTPMAWAGTLTGVVNVNTAGVEQLTMLPGVGERRAHAIVALRKERGGTLRRVEDLLAVKGIGEKSLAKLRPFVSLQGKTTLAAK